MLSTVVAGPCLAVWTYEPFIGQGIKSARAWVIAATWVCLPTISPFEDRPQLMKVKCQFSCRQGAISVILPKLYLHDHCSRAFNRSLRSNATSCWSWHATQCSCTGGMFCISCRWGTKICKHNNSPPGPWRWLAGISTLLHTAVF